MKKTIAVLLVGMILLISANSVLAYHAFCDFCEIIIDGDDICNSRTEGYYSCYYFYDDEIECRGLFWYCYTDWICFDGHLNERSNTHVHESAYHTCGVFMNGTHCPY